MFIDEMNDYMLKKIRIKLAKYLTIFLSLLLITSKVAQSAEMPNHHFMQNKVMQNKVAIFYSDTFLLHDTGAHHPENADRLKKVFAQLKNKVNLSSALIWPSFLPATRQQLALVHTPQYLQLVEDETNALVNNSKNNSVVQLSTGDTNISRHTQTVAMLAVGAGIAAADAVMTRHVTSAFAIIRPPGHHATQSRGMGFCVYNNIAVTARYLQKQHGIKRILIVDFDVHHGNGTQAIFEDDFSVFYFSVHQHPLYPGTGMPTEKGSGKGLGYTLNVALPAGAGDDALLNALQQQLKPAMVSFKPEFILVSAGFDAHNNDPLGGLKYSDAGYAQAATELAAIANQSAAGRMVYMLEGGYSADNIANAVSGILEVLVNKR